MMREEHTRWALAAEHGRSGRLHRQTRDSWGHD